MQEYSNMIFGILFVIYMLFLIILSYISGLVSSTNTTAEKVLDILAQAFSIVPGVAVSAYAIFAYGVNEMYLLADLGLILLICGMLGFVSSEAKKTGAMQRRDTAYEREKVVLDTSIYGEAIREYVEVGMAIIGATILVWFVFATA